MDNSEINEILSKLELLIKELDIPNNIKFSIINRINRIKCDINKHTSNGEHKVYKKHNRYGFSLKEI